MLAATAQTFFAFQWDIFLLEIYYSQA